MAATKIYLTLTWCRVVPMKTFQHENLSYTKYENFQIYGSGYSLLVYVFFSIVCLRLFIFAISHSCRLTGDDKEVQLRCAKAWSGWELNTLKLIADPATIQTKLANDTWALAFAKIEW